MSDEDDFELASPDVGASSSRDVVPPMTAHDSDDNDENQSEYSINADLPQKKQHTRKKDNQEWSLHARIDKDGREPEEIQALVFAE